jgi:hypothetical protein
MVLGPMEQNMKRKVGTLIEEEVIKLAKRRAFEESRPLSDVIRDAIVLYLGNQAPSPKKSESAYGLFCERPMRITKKQLKAVMEKDAWDP